ncbi:hypothetical protein PN498_08905 [Oscillatoria sp. CS-180]|uniref:hypothetical protein n=1 Tax=Oscillatoria sp. CS-180 TaxID=3021720 RepID=UPI00232AD761|nr:hypothetical protein [Oscillatoria sp. CS-180]MDB9526104.1 hypothetical protein [Oscillatoria sp. CS-180]
MAKWCVVVGTISQGYRVASGLTANSPYPQGTLAMQLPHFLSRGFDLRPYFLGTLNVAIAPKHFQMVNPEITLELVSWTPAHGPETFSFSRCQLTWKSRTFEGWIYYPHPETKPLHFQKPDLVEVLMPKIEGLQYGDRVQLAVLTNEIQLIDSEDQ